MQTHAGLIVLIRWVELIVLLAASGKLGLEIAALITLGPYSLGSPKQVSV